MSERLVLHPRWTWLGDNQVERGLGVLVEDGAIIDLGRDLPESGARVVDLPTHLLLPGLINVQTQAAAGAVVRGMAEDLSLVEGATYYTALSNVWPVAYREEFRDELRAITRWDIFGMLRTGTTTFVSRASIDIEGLLEAAGNMGLRVYGHPNLPLSVRHRLGYIQEGKARRDDVTTDMASELDDWHTLFKRYDGSYAGRVRVILGPASAHTVPLDILRKVRELADEVGCRITTHLAQAPAEVAETKVRYGKSPARVLDDAGLLRSDVIAAIAAFVDDEDLPLLKESGVYIAHCASRKSKEAITTPFLKFLEFGIPVALGTDAYFCDMVEEMKTAAMLGKIGDQRIDLPDAITVLRAATATGAAAVGRADLGKIARGAAADLVAVNLGKPHNSPVFDPLRMLVYYSNGNDVDFVMVDGKPLIEDGRPVFEDDAALARRAQAGAERIWEQAEREGAIPPGR